MEPIDPIVKVVGTGTVGALLGGLIAFLVVLIWWLIVRDKPSTVAVFTAELSRERELFSQEMAKERQLCREQFNEITIAFKDYHEAVITAIEHSNEVLMLSLGHKKE